MVRGMNQNERDDLAIYLGLQDFEVALVEVEASRRRGRIKVISLARRSGSHRCPSHRHSRRPEAQRGRLQGIDPVRGGRQLRGSGPTRVPEEVARTPATGVAPVPWTVNICGIILPGVTGFLASRPLTSESWRPEIVAGSPSLGRWTLAVLWRKHALSRDELSRLVRPILQRLGQPQRAHALLAREVGDRACHA